LPLVRKDISFNVLTEGLGERLGRIMVINEVDVVRWLHILAMVYWLGGEWGVFQTSYHVTNRDLSLDERRRHMETAYRIDILARTGIIMLLPLGLHMGHLYGFTPFLDGIGLAIMWTLSLSWLALCWAAFFKRETDMGIALTKLDEKVRFVLIPALFAVAILAFLGHGPLAIETGSYWYPAKMFTYALMLVFGLGLRFIMREWTTLFRVLAEGPNQAAQTQLEISIGRGRMIAYCYWIGIATTAFFGAVKPF
jgi:hypothetical protein